MSPPDRLRWSALLLIGLLWVLGLGLRAAALRANDDLPHGDVNLHALAARQFANDGRLHYPMKFDFGAHLPYLAETTPASLHPRGTAFLGGILSRVSGLDAYAALRVLSILAGSALLLLAGWLALKHRPAFDAGLLVLVATSPLLVDFSGNGSPYAAATLFMAVGGLWLGFGPREHASFGLVAGGLAALALEFHGATIALALASVLVCLLDRRTAGWRALATFALAFAALRAPSVLWSWRETGSPLSPVAHLLRAYRLGLVEPVVEGERVVLRALPLSGVSPMALLRQSALESLRLARGLLVEAGPCVLILAGAGMARMREDKRFLAAALPGALFLLVVLAWGAFEQRFLVPLLPTVLGCAGLGYAGLRRRGEAGARRFAQVLLAGALVWFVALAVRGPVTRYHAHEREYRALYPPVRELAQRFGAEPLETGRVLGFHASGLGALFWHERPYVHAPFARGELARRIADDFEVRYAWVARRRLDEWRAVLPVRRTVLENEDYVVLELDER